jgi:hypothetical protein
MANQATLSVPRVILGSMKPLTIRMQEQLSQLSLDFGCTVDIGSEFYGTLEHWFVRGLVPIDDDGQEHQQVATLHFVRGKLGDPELWEALDAAEADLEAVGSAVLDTRTGELADDLEEQIEPMGESLLVLDSAKMSKDWRGFGVGVYVAGLALRHLSAGARMAALYPAPLNKLDEQAREVAIQKLGRAWSQLGFQPYRAGVWVLDLALLDLEQGIAALGEGLCV